LTVTAAAPPLGLGLTALCAGVGVAGEVVAIDPVGEALFEQAAAANSSATARQTAVPLVDTISSDSTRDGVAETSYEGRYGSNATIS